MNRSAVSNCALLLVGCNAVFGIEQHEYREPTGTAGVMGTAGAAVAGAAGTAGTGAADSGPFVALWHFEAMDGARVFSSSDPSLPLTVQGGELSLGPTGNHLVLANSAGSAVASEPVLQASGDFSISVWVRLDQLNGWHTIVSQDGESISPFYLQKHETNAFAFTTYPADSTGSTPCIATSSLHPKPGEWYHLVATRDAETGEQRIYVDGILAGKATCAGGFRAEGPLVIGRGKWNVPADWMSGAVDELGVAARVLSPEEIFDLYQLGRPDARHYLFAYFEEGELARGDGLHLAHSHDGLHWGAVGAGKVFFRPSVGGLSFRDPHVLRDPNGTYHVVWTTSCLPWAQADCVQDRGFGHATTSDFVTFSNPKFIEIPREKLDAEHFWAPETFYDAANGQYLLSWASPLDVTPGPDPHSIYYMLTTDFVTFTDPAVLYGRPGRDFIDATILRGEGAYFLFVKDEAEGQKNVRGVSSPSLFGSAAWTNELSAPLTGAVAAEGPTWLARDGEILLFFDKYVERSTGALRSRALHALEDPSAWEDITPSVGAAGLRHGTALEVSVDVLRAVALAAAR
ncbi:MAG TPA: LamG-like jellyroll fold domain-containing protein [Polyangiaceae bacterium]